MRRSGTSLSRSRCPGALIAIVAAAAFLLAPLPCCVMPRCLPRGNKLLGAE